MGIPHWKYWDLLLQELALNDEFAEKFWKEHGDDEEGKRIKTMIAERMAYCEEHCTYVLPSGIRTNKEPSQGQSQEPGARPPSEPPSNS